MEEGDCDLVAEGGILTIEHELADMNGAALEIAAELDCIGPDSLVEGSPCRF